MDALSFTPWRVTAEHAPLGNTQYGLAEITSPALVPRPNALPAALLAY